MARGRSISRSARSGRFVSRRSVSRRPRRNTTERVGGSTRNSRPVYRSASSGRFITKSHARRSPHTTIRQMV